MKTMLTLLFSLIGLITIFLAPSLHSLAAEQIFNFNILFFTYLICSVSIYIYYFKYIKDKANIMYLIIKLHLLSFVYAITLSFDSINDKELTMYAFVFSLIIVIIHFVCIFFVKKNRV